MSLISLVVLGLLTPSLLAGTITKKSADSSTSSTSSSDDLSTTGQYLGYGYNAFKGSVYQTSDVFRFNSPILKRDLLKDKFVTVNTAKTIYSNNTSTSKTEISKELGQENSGGASTTAQAQIGVANINASLSATFNMSGTESWSSVQNESFSYYNIYAQKDTVALQIDFNESSSTTYFTDEFLKAARNITTEEQAESFFNTYGTHLVTGYNLGGLFQMTNYYATKSSSYVKESTTSFATQVETGVSVMNKAGGSVGAEYSFTERYGTKDNNSYAVNQYKLLTYGGKAFSGLTIDQAFTFSATLTEQGDYLYGAWVKSVNEGTNNVIISIPDGSPMIPLYKALPNDGNYKTAKSLLLNKYLELTQEATAEYRKNNKDAIYTDMKERSYDDPSIKVSGYDRYSLADNGLSYFSTSQLGSDDTITVREGDRISLNYSASDTEGTTCAWYLKNKSLNGKYITALGTDASTGDGTYDAFAIKTGTDAASGKTLTLVYATGADATPLKTIKVKIDKNAFPGGTGTSDDPYLITNKDDFAKIYSNLETSDGSASCFKLACDITLDNTAPHQPIGTYEEPFKGTFDGDGHTIKGLKLTDESLSNTGHTYDCSDATEHDNYIVGLFGKIAGGATVKNLIVDGADASFSSNKFVQNAGIICGRNEGTLSNCYVKNSKICLTASSSPSTVLCGGWTSSVGGLCGRVDGNGVSVTGCGIENSTVSSDGHGYAFTCLGGLLGSVNSKATISSCYSKGCEISNKIRFDRYDSQLYVGGLVGYATENVAFKNCLARNESVLSSTEYACEFITVGGFLGTAKIPNDASSDESDEYRLLDCCLVDQTTSGSLSLVRPSSQTDTAKAGAAIGYLDYSGSKINSYFYSVYCKSSDISDNLGGDKKDTTVSNFKTDTSFTGFSSSVWSGSSFTTKTIKTHMVKDVAFNFDGAKTEFVKGEAFYAGGIYGTKEYVDGSDDENFENFFIDYSEFDSNEAGTYTITVSAYGFSGSYDVTVRNAKVTRLDAALGSSTTYYAGDALDESDINITAYYEDGTTSAVAGNADGVQITKSSKTLVEGQNKIAVTYQNVSSYFIVTTEKKEIESISIVTQPSKTSYSTKDKTVDLSGLAIDVSYSNDGLADETILYSTDTKDDFMAYYGDFDDGSNKIDIVYKEFQAPSIYVNATSPALDAELLTSFVNAVAALDDVTSLEAYRTALIEAVNCRTALQNKYAAYELAKSESYVTANTKLESCIAEYKQAVGEINSDYETAIAPGVEISMGFVGGFDLLLAVLECVFSLIFGI